MSARTLRQRLVAEIGDRGQARIAESVAHASDAISARYLACAGFLDVFVIDEACVAAVRSAAPDANVVIDRTIEPANRFVIDLDESVASVFHGSIEALRAIRESSK